MYLTVRFDYDDGDYHLANQNQQQHQCKVVIDEEALCNMGTQRVTDQMKEMYATYYYSGNGNSARNSTMRKQDKHVHIWVTETRPGVVDRCSLI